MSLARPLIPTDTPRRPAEARRTGTSGPSQRAWWRHPAFAVGVPLALGLVHVALVAPHYFVGSFDDDAGYILTAKALLAGEGLTGHVANGTLVAGSYPPGYSALLVPLVWLWPHSFLPLRLLSVGCYAALFPLTWVYLGRHRVGDPARIATLTVLALGPPLATFASMVMAETPFLVLFLLLLLLVDRWEVEIRAYTRTGLAVVLAAAGLVWLKEAGIGLVAGLVIWLVWRRGAAWERKVAAVVSGVAVLLLPVLVARIVGGVPVAGSQYSSELGSFYQGGLVHRLLHVVPDSLWHMLSTALPATVIPYLSPLPISGRDADLWKILSWQLTVLTVVGAVIWTRRHRGGAIVMVPAYLAMTLLWPEVNERRVILVLPVLVAWYVLGAEAVWELIRDRVGARPGPPRTRRLAGARATAMAAVAAVVIVPLTFQMPRDYLFRLGQSSSHFEGSRYVRILEQLGPPTAVVETDYLSSTALFAGHDTAWTAFSNTVAGCDPTSVRAGLAADDAGYLLLGDVNKPGLLDRPCLLSAAGSSSWAVQLLHTSRDNATVFELIGPGTGHPNLQDLAASATETTTMSPGPATAAGASAGASAPIVEAAAPVPARTTEWEWASPEPIAQVTVGEAGSAGATTSVVVQLRGVDGTWRNVASARSSVGDAPAAAPYLLATLPAASVATALRVVIFGPGAIRGPGPEDVHALGSRTASAP